MSEHVFATNDTQFEADVLQSDVPVLVDFWAEWCSPCKMIAPVLDEVAGEYVGRLKVMKVNVDESSETPAKYGVRGIPSLLIFKDGNLLGSHTGALTKSQLNAFIDKYL